jgi:hypothetical protein
MLLAIGTPSEKEKLHLHLGSRKTPGTSKALPYKVLQPKLMHGLDRRRADLDEGSTFEKCPCAKKPGHLALKNFCAED